MIIGGRKSQITTVRPKRVINNRLHGTIMTFSLHFWTLFCIPSLVFRYARADKIGKSAQTKGDKNDDGKR